MTRREVVKCPILNKHNAEQYHPSTLEVIIAFDASNSPRAIMCDCYDHEKKVCEIKAGISEYKSKLCTYAGWRDLDLPEEAE